MNTDKTIFLSWPVRLVLCASMLVCGHVSFPATAAAPPASRPVAKLDLRIDPKEWNDDVDTVEKILRGTAADFLGNFPEQRPEPITVFSKGGPIVLFKRDDGRVAMKLDTGGRLWAQYVFQFSHEFCHVMSRYREEDAGNKWFEESLCETASLYELRRLGRVWRDDPPFPAMRDFSKHLTAYAQERTDKASLPEGKSLAAWYRENSAALRKEPADRARNNVVAARLLPLFEADPAGWEAVWYLNLSKNRGVRSFRVYLRDWQANSPEKHRVFIGKIGTKFDIGLQQRDM